MEKKTEILVIGGGPAGMVCALTARKYYPDKSITLMTDVKEGVVPCGIPYMLSALKSPRDNAMAFTPLRKKNIEVIIDKAVGIDRTGKVVLTEAGDQYKYEKLVLAVGSSPIIPSVPGIDQEGIFLVKKEMPYLLKMVKEMKVLKRVLVVGGGFIGIEFADELSHLEDHQVYLVELLPRLLANSFDPEFSVLAEEKLREEGVTVLTGTEVTEFIGDGRVEKVRFSDGKELAVDGVIIGIGARPNIDIAAEADLVLKGQKGIWVDEYLRTVDPDIFAIGDCATKRDFYTRKGISVMLASTATAEARVAGANLFKLKVIRENKGTIAIYSTYINGLVLGSAGLTETNAEKEGFEITVGTTEAVDKHPASMPFISKLRLKLIFSRHSGIILGGQVAGGITCGEIINVIGMAIQKRDSLTELETLQMATHPWLTTAPTKYPLVMAALAAEGEGIV
ncbi:MAG: FAD-dependent oxidoreductase [Candidatus Euphemobacter frigidus]|nr:FAD-dependent oxidoreductase [Candidatus Euphemobacter frigidus]MDP8275850.1 FAD-dependent oxidoreductase [Candidatus Euphemobacter frigidus]